MSNARKLPYSPFCCPRDTSHQSSQCLSSPSCNASRLSSQKSCSVTYSTNHSVSAHQISSLQPPLPERRRHQTCHARSRERIYQHTSQLPPRPSRRRLHHRIGPLMRRPITLHRILKVLPLTTANSTRRARHRMRRRPQSSRKRRRRCGGDIRILAPHPSITARMLRIRALQTSRERRREAGMT